MREPEILSLSGTRVAFSAAPDAWLRCIVSSATLFVSETDRAGDKAFDTAYAARLLAEREECPGFGLK